MEVERINTKVSETKNISIAEFKESKAYKSFLISTITMLLTRKKIIVYLGLT